MKTILMKNLTDNFTSNDNLESKVGWLQFDL